jgi:meso-butanediol dehydrogenase/(S,S)-butanediol dehydrogenase/diacetyl reductase
MDLEDTTAIVTGGARGIGRGIALELAKAGANIVIADLPSVQNEMEETQRLVAEEGRLSLLAHCDVTDETQTSALAQAALERFGKIDTLVNNAGVISVAPVMAMTEQQWDRVIDVNLKGTFLCSKAVARHMMERRSGRIVNLSSQAGRRGAPALSHYCATKWGVIGFTQSLALEMAQFNVTVNAVCPGEVDSARWQETLLPAIAASQGVSREEAWNQFMLERVPLGRPQTPADIGEAVVFLCRAENITGEALNVTGGSEIR